MEEQLSTNQYLTFKVDNENYAISVVKIREVLEFQSASMLPRMPSFMRGIINLRGSVVPVIDLKMKFNLGETKKSINTSVIVTELKVENEEVVIGILTDAVNEVIDFEDSDIEPAPNIGTSIDASFIQGMGKKDGEFIIILNINQILSSEEIMDLASSETA